MSKSTVRRRIFISNALMVIVTLGIFLILNISIIKIYLKTAEDELKVTFEQMAESEEPGELLEDWIIHQNKFVALFGIDGLLCIIILAVVSQIFTRNLSKHIMEPLDILLEGTEKIRDNDYTHSIQYNGDTEFEDVCNSFNSMRESILEERDKNDRYEKARTDMIAGISHDLRTPLTAVRGSVKGLMDGVADSQEQQMRFLKTAYRRTEEMDALLKQLFYVSGIETGHINSDFQLIEINEFLNDYVKGKRDVINTANEKIILTDKGILADIHAVPEHLQRILDNLLENSRKYAGRNFLEVEISLEKQAGEIVIIFRDNGKGVPDEKLPYIFDEFYRVDESRNSKGGNGLGLYIVRYLMKLMGGSVEAENDGGLAISLKMPVEVWRNEKADE